MADIFVARPGSPIARRHQPLLRLDGSAYATRFNPIRNSVLTAARLSLPSPAPTSTRSAQHPRDAENPVRIPPDPM